MRLVVLGDPVEHSLSPTLHTAALAAAGIEGTYEARTVDAEGLASAADEVRSGVLAGANITMPHKTAARDLADRTDATAARSGSVNTWVREGSTIVGYSTDGAGVEFAIQHAGLPTTGRVLMLGAGGAASAALGVLDSYDVSISARRRGAAEALADRLGVEVDIVEWGTAIPGALVINATPIGMHGARLPDGIVGAAGALLDMVYREKMTPAVAAAKRRDIPTCDGLPMLVGQALASFRLWTGVDMPSDVMLQAVNLSSSAATPPKNQESRSSGVEPCR